MSGRIVQFEIGCKLAYRSKAETPFVFNIEAQRFNGQAIDDERLSTTPHVEVARWTMPESGNRYLRVIAPAGPFTIEYTARATLTPAFEDPQAVGEVPPARLPLSVFTHLYPSRYCQSDKLERFARSTFGDLPAGYARVNGICNWIYEYVFYEGGASDALTSAFDTVTQRAGVCRDFAHLGIALCRALGIPARYVSAYAFRLDPPDFHAVFEAYLGGPQGGEWYLFDATRMADPAGLVRIGLGRDAAEVAFCSPYGPVEFDKPEVWIKAIGDAPEATVKAIRPLAG
jgi:transglutaminase-like putative cysteine protease